MNNYPQENYQQQQLQNQQQFQNQQEPSWGQSMYNRVSNLPQGLGLNRQVGQDPCTQFSGVSNTDPRAEQARQLGCVKKTFSLGHEWYNPNLRGGINKSKKFKGGKYKKKSSKKFKGGKTKRKSNKKYKGGKSKKYRHKQCP